MGRKGRNSADSLEVVKKNPRGGEAGGSHRLQGAGLLD